MRRFPLLTITVFLRDLYKGVTGKTRSTKRAALWALQKSSVESKEGSNFIKILKPKERQHIRLRRKQKKDGTRITWSLLTSPILLAVTLLSTMPKLTQPFDITLYEKLYQSCGEEGVSALFHPFVRA